MGQSWGIDFGSYDSAEGGGFAAFPKAENVHFVINKPPRHGQDKNGNPYVIFYLKCLEGEHEGKMMTKFWGLGPERIPYFKGFAEAIGCGDLLRPDADSDDFTFVEFLADVYHYANKAGDAQADLRNCRPFSTVTAPEDTAPPPAPAAPPSAAAPSPARPNPFKRNK